MNWQHLSHGQLTPRDEQTGMYWLGSLEAANLNCFWFCFAHTTPTQHITPAEQTTSSSFLRTCYLLHNITKQRGVVAAYVKPFSEVVSLYDFRRLTGSSLKKWLQEAAASNHYEYIIIQSTLRCVLLIVGSFGMFELRHAEFDTRKLFLPSSDKAVKFPCGHIKFCMICDITACLEWPIMAQYATLWTPPVHKHESVSQIGDIWSNYMLFSLWRDFTLSAIRWKIPSASWQSAKMSRKILAYRVLAKIQYQVLTGYFLWKITY